MKIVTPIIAAVALVLGAIGLAYGVTGRSAAHAETRQIAQLAREDTALKQELDNVLPRLTGARRDLITCADIQNMGLQDTYGVNLTQDSSGNIFASPEQSPISLPSHCINH